MYKHLGTPDELVDCVDHVEKKTLVCIAAGNILHTRVHPVAHPEMGLVVGEQLQQFLQQWIAQHGDEVGGQFDFLQVSNEALRTINVF